jgi:hypothetical protein
MPRLTFSIVYADAATLRAPLQRRQQQRGDIKIMACASDGASAMMMREKALKSLKSVAP